MKKHRLVKDKNAIQPVIMPPGMLAKLVSEVGKELVEVKAKEEAEKLASEGIVVDEKLMQLLRKRATLLAKIDTTRFIRGLGAVRSTAMKELPEVEAQIEAQKKALKEKSVKKPFWKGLFKKKR